jgi:hypothetical protein
MRKLSHTFSPSSSHLAIVFAAVALLIAPPVAAGQSGGSHNNVKAAQIVTVTKRAKTRAVPTKTVSRQADPDRDGLSTWIEEHSTRTNPRKFDTDRDGFGDGAEVAAGTDPRNRASRPAGPPAPTPPPVVTPPVVPPPPADTTAPATMISSGPSDTTTSTGASFAFTSSESGSTFLCSLDSGSWAACISPKAYSGLTVGTHTFSVKATDAAGNADASPATRSWTVQATTPPPPADTTPPDTAISSGPSGTTTATTASIGFSATESGSTFTCKLDSSSWSSCTSAKSYSGLATGSHAFSVRATDGAGNTDATPATDTWTVQATTPPPDTTPPDTTIDSGPTGTTTSTSANLAFSSSESGSTYQCSLDSGPWGSCVSPKSYSGLAVGSHAFSVKATDAAGNTDASPATRSWTVQSESTGGGGGGGGGGGNCTQTLASGANLSNAVSSAVGGAVICLGGGSYSVNVTKANKASMVTIKPAAGAAPSLGYSMLNQATNLRFEDLKFTGGIEALGPASKLQFVDNEFVGPFGFHGNGQQQSNGTEVTDVLFDGNYLHDLDYSGNQGTANGYGLTASNGVSRFTVTNNTIKSTASDYLQFASPNTVTIDHNTFLGPSLLGSHQDHQDLVQIFGGGKNVTFTNNVARNTETQESLLFQEGAFSNVVIENNLFDHDSRGYTCQLYQSSGMIFRDNTVVGSHWGCLFRDLASSAAGSGYQIDHNIFTNTAEGSDISTEGRAGSWGVYDYNVSEDGSADGSHSVRNWSPSWSDTTSYTPLGLPFAAGYRP